MTHRSALALACAVALAALFGFASIGAAADAPAPQSVQVPIAPVDASGSSGIAIVSSADPVTTVQILVPGATEGSTATIHTGSCDEVGTELVGLIGELSVAGQAQASIPVAFATLTDGRHVITVHPAMDFAVRSACGLIPAGTVVPPLPEPVDESCIGVPAWVEAAEADLAEMKKTQDDLAQIIDVQAYLIAVAASNGQAQGIIARMATRPVPEAASATHQQFIAAIEAGIVVGTELIDAFTRSDPALYQQAITNAQAVNQQTLAVRTAVAELKVRCPG